MPPDDVDARLLAAIEAGKTPRDASSIADPELAAAMHAWGEIEQAFAVLRKPAEPNDGAEAAPEIPGYRNLRFIARGGQAAVYRAEHVALQRTVALKRMHAAAGPDAVARFQAEAQLAAGLDHPHIVPLFEVGEHAGRPYLSMAFVEGETLAARIARQPPATREAAQIVETLARAVCYAHQQGVVHRDIKPGNVLIGEEGRPRLADFGLAKAVAADQTLSASGHVIGTPSYMPPEQAVDSSQAGPAADIYGLGAVLYAALTARPPFQTDQPIETLRQVVTSDPVPPRRLNPTVDADLETICLKCLEKEPARRYGTAEALADDLQRYLNGQPIRARPLGRLARFARWARRRPALASLSAALLLALTLGGTGIVWQWSIATQSALHARQQSRQAQQSAAQADNAVKKYFTAVSEEVLLDEPGMAPLRQKLLGLALDYYRQFLETRGKTPELLAERAEAQYRVARITARIGSQQEAVAHYEQATHRFQELLRRERRGEFVMYLARCRNNVGLLHAALDDAVAATRCYEESIRALREGPSDLRESPEFAHALAAAYSNLGALQRKQRKYEAARQSFEQAVSLRENAGHDRADSPHRRSLAFLYHRMGSLMLNFRKRDEAIRWYEKAIKLREQLAKERPEVTSFAGDLAASYNNLAVSNRLGRNVDRAIDHYLQAIALQQRLCLQNPQVSRHQSELARLNYAVASLLQLKGRWKEAADALRVSVDNRAALLARHPGDVAQRTSLANSYRSLANALARLDQWAEMRQAVEQAVKIRSQLLAQDDSSVKQRANLALDYERLCSACRETDDLPAAEQAIAAALQLRNELLAGKPESKTFLRAVQTDKITQAECRLEDGDAAKAEQLVGEAVGVLTKLHQEAPKHVLTARLVARAEGVRGEALAHQKKFLPAAAAWETASKTCAPEQRLLFGLRRGWALARGGKQKEALAIVAKSKVEETEPPAAANNSPNLQKTAASAERYYLAAAVLAACAESPPSSAPNSAARRAIALLDKCRRAGYFTAARRRKLARDARFDPLRSHADYPQWARPQ